MAKGKPVRREVICGCLLIGRWGPHGGGAAAVAVDGRPVDGRCQQRQPGREIRRRRQNLTHEPRGHVEPVGARLLHEICPWR